MSDQFPLSCKYIANTECTILHPFSIHFPSIYHCFPSIFQFLWSWTAEAYGLLQPRLSETLSYFAEGQTPSVEAAAENLGQAPKKARSLFFFLNGNNVTDIYIIIYIYTHSTHTYILYYIILYYIILYYIILYYIILYYSILYYHRLYIYIYIK